MTGDEMITFLRGMAICDDDNVSRIADKLIAAEALSEAVWAVWAASENSYGYNIPLDVLRQCLVYEDAGGYREKI